MNKFQALFEKLTGIDKVRTKALAEAQEALRLAREAEESAIEAVKEAAKAKEQEHEAKEAERLAKLSPKEIATEKKEPYIAVMETRLNPDNPRNGFFELDWNEFFIKELIQNGYGVENDPQEEIVDRWFRDIIYQMLDEEGLDKSRGSGYINVVPISKGKSQVS